MHKTQTLRQCFDCLGEMTPFTFRQLHWEASGWVCVECGRMIWGCQLSENERIILAMYQNGIKNARIISERLNLSAAHVRRTIRLHPATEPKHDISKLLNTRLEYELWVNDYKICKKQADVARRFGVSRARVCQVLKERGLN